MGIFPSQGTEFKNRALMLLGEGGCNAAQAAAAIGCDPSYISQLMADDEFAMQVATARSASLEKELKRDANWDTLEDSLLRRMNDMLPFMNRPMEIIRAASIANAAKRRAIRGTAAGDGAGNAQVLVLQLPPIIEHHYTLNQNKEVVEIGGRTMATINSNTLLNHVNGSKVHDAINNEVKRGLAARMETAKVTEAQLETIVKIVEEPKTMQEKSANELTIDDII